MNESRLNQPQLNPEKRSEEEEQNIKETIEDEQYKAFVDKGEVSNETLSSIAEKIKNNEDLTPREKAIRIDKTSEVESLIQESHKNKEAPEIPKEVAGKLEDLNISKEDISSIEGFGDLSKGKQLLVIENLKQVSLGKIKEKALKKHEKEISKSGILKIAWKVISEKYQIAKKEKETKKELYEAGIDEHKEILHQLVKGADEGPSVEVKEDGSLELQYVDPEDFDGKQQKIVRQFNQSANKFSQVPDEWGYESTATKQQLEQYKKAKELYEHQRDRLLEIVKETKGEVEGALFINKKEASVKMNRFLNANPKVEKALQSIDNEKAWKKLFSGLASDKGLYFAGGFAARSAAIGMFGLIAAPFAAAGIGGFIARKRAEKQLQKQEKEMRRGGKPKESPSKNFVDAKKLTKRMEFKLEKFDDLKNKINTEKDSAKREKLKFEMKEMINSLKARVSYTQRKMEEGLVNYGKSKESYQNKYKLLQKLSTASATSEVLGYYQNEDKEKDILFRTDRYLKFKGEKIEDSQKKHVRSQMWKGAIISASFATAGWAFRDLGNELFNWKGGSHILEAHQEIKEKATQAAGSAGEAIKDHLEGLAYPKDIDPEEVYNWAEDFIPFMGDTTIAEEAAETSQSIQEQAPFLHAEYQGGSNLWDELENQFKKRGGVEFFANASKEAEQTFGIDYLKDKIAENSTNYGLDEGININKLTKEQLKNINYDKLFGEVLSSPEEMQNIAPNLSEEARQNILRNNRLNHFVNETRNYTNQWQKNIPPETTLSSPDNPELGLDKILHPEDYPPRTSEKLADIHRIKDIAENLRDQGIEIDNLNSFDSIETIEGATDKQIAESLAEYQSSGSEKILENISEEAISKDVTVLDKGEYIIKNTEHIATEAKIKFIYDIKGDIKGFLIDSPAMESGWLDKLLEENWGQEIQSNMEKASPAQLNEATTDAFSRIKEFALWEEIAEKIPEEKEKSFLVDYLKKAKKAAEDKFGNIIK